MAGISTIDRSEAIRKPLRMPQERFSRGGWHLRYPPIFSFAGPRAGENLRTPEDDVDAVVPVDAQTAPTRDLENCPERSFPQRPHRSFVYLAEREEEKTEERTITQRKTLTISTTKSV